MIMKNRFGAMLAGILALCCSQASAGIMGLQAARLEIEASHGHADAFSTLRRAAESGDPIAQSALGLYYGGKQDYAKAVYWFQKAAVQGNADAEYNLGVLYDDGQGVPLDYAKAVYWYRKAAAQGLAVAESNLGRFYGTGQGTPRDDVKSVYWYRRAANQGDTNAELNLGLAYATGQGVPTDYVVAYKWLVIAKAYAKPGIRQYRQADQAIGLLLQEMTTAQIAQAQAEAAAWVKTHSP